MKHWPREIRRWICLGCRNMADVMSGRHSKLVTPDTLPHPDAVQFKPQLSLEQRVMSTENSDAKIHNLKRASARMQNRIVKPGEIFSFWRIVGPPTAANEFQLGRSLLGGRLQLDYGGGLCQLSGLLYQLSLQAGLTILERHPHSRDIYRETERYAPLGADATVAYGFKDLRIQNNTKTEICFRISLNAERIKAELCSPENFKPRAVEFIRIRESKSDCTVETRRWCQSGSNYEIVTISNYRRLPTDLDL